MIDQVAVVILNFFGHNDSLACIQSVLSTLNAQIFLVDNSVDDREKKFLEKSFQDVEDVRLFFSRENLGFAAGVNLGLREAVAAGFTKFLLLNNDAQLLENAGVVLGRALAENSNSLVSPSIVWNGAVCKGKFYNKYLGLLSDKPIGFGNSDVFYLSGCAIAFNKYVLDELGFWDESFFMYGEDVDYCYRARRRGVDVVLLPETIVEHHGSKAAKQASFFYEYHIVRSHFLLIERLFDSYPQRFAAYVGKLITLTARATWRCIRFGTLTPLAGLLLAPFHLAVRPARRSCK